MEIITAISPSHLSPCSRKRLQSMIVLAPPPLRRLCSWPSLSAATAGRRRSAGAADARAGWFGLSSLLCPLFSPRRAQPHLASPSNRATVRCGSVPAPAPSRATLPLDFSRHRASNSLGWGGMGWMGASAEGAPERGGKGEGSRESEGQRRHAGEKEEEKESVCVCVCVCARSFRACFSAARARTHAPHTHTHNHPRTVPPHCPPSPPLPPFQRCSGEAPRAVARHHPRTCAGGPAGQMRERGSGGAKRAARNCVGRVRS